eukprot:2719923-Prymnesium_polylepis.1
MRRAAWRMRRQCGASAAPVRRLTSGARLAQVAQLDGATDGRRREREGAVGCSERLEGNVRDGALVRGVRRDEGGGARRAR